MEKLKKLENVVYDSIKSVTVNNYPTNIEDIKQQLSNVKRSTSMNNQAIENLVLKIENENNKINTDLAGFESVKNVTDRIYFEPNLDRSRDELVLGSIQMGAVSSTEEDYPRLITANLTRIQIWDLKTNECLQEIDHEYYRKSKINCLLKLNNFVITASYDGFVKYWNLNLGICIKRKFISHGIKSALNFSNRYLIFGFNCGKIRIFEAETFQCLTHINAHKNNCHVNHLISYEEDKFISCSNDGIIKIWSVDSPNNLRFKLTTDQKPINRLILLENNRLISGNSDGEIRLWCLQSKECIESIKAHRFSICSFEIMKNTNELLSCDKSGMIKIWNLHTFISDNMRQEHTSRILCIKSVNDSQFVTCSIDSTVRIWNIDTNECINSIEAGEILSSLFF